MSGGRYFDVVVLGPRLGALLAAALLARRGFSVLLLGNGQKKPTYEYERFTLARRPFSLLGATSPVLRRALVELAQSQTFKRKLVALDPMLSVVAPDRRYEIPPDLALFEREIDREFPEVRRVVDDLYGTLARVNEAADRAFSADVVMPPGSFWERRQAARALAGVPFLSATRNELLADFPLFHPYRAVVERSVAFATDLAAPFAEIPAFAAARLHGSWTRGVYTLPGAEDELTQFLLDRLAAHGGRVALDERIEKVVTEPSGVAGVVVDGDVARTGCQFLLFSGSGEELAALAKGEGLSARALREWPRLSRGAGRFLANVVVANDAVPDALGLEALLFPTKTGDSPDPRRPVVRLSRSGPAPAAGSTRLLVELLLPDRGGLVVPDAREAILAALRQHFPYLDRHLRVVDSPHDGLPLWLYEQGKRREIDRIHVRGADIRAEPMEAQLTVAGTSFHGLGAEPVRGPIERTFLIGRTVLPALGQEGELLAAAAAARLVTKSDPRKEKLRLEMWNRVEIG